MLYYRCKCGNSTSWGSVPPSPCTSCPECGTTMDANPESHSEPMPHEFKTKYNENTGVPYEICTICYRTKKELDIS